MVIIVKGQQEDVDRVVEFIKRRGLCVHLSKGAERTIVGVIGDVREVPAEQIELLPGVERVVRILHRFKLSSKDFNGDRTVVKVKNLEFGGDSIVVAAGPCAIESRALLKDVAKAVALAGAHMLRGGAYKPRTSPYSFQGLGEEGLVILREVADELGMPCVTEVVSPGQVEKVAEYADVLQIGTRNMQNFSLLQEAGRSGKPVLLKRGLMSSIEEWLQAADYILSEGNPNVILCERGIRTFEPYTRNTLDLSAVPVVKKLSHLPVIVDPSHGTGRWDLVVPMAKAAVAAGADGLLVEVHTDPEHALSDGHQSLKPPVFEQMMRDVSCIARALGRTVPGL